MEKEVLIRKAEIRDFDRIHKLIMQVHKLHIIERSDVYKDCDPFNLQELEKALSSSNNIYLIAEIKNEVVGICFAEIKDITNDKIMKNRKVLHIKDICVDETIRRQGIGRLLYNEMLQLARRKKIDNIELMVWGFNKNAMKFYESLGMKIKNLKYEQKI